MAIDKKKLSRNALDYIILTLGTFMYCMAWEWLVIPNNYSSGGATGLLTILQYATNGAIPVGISYPVLNIFLLVLAFFVLGKGFGVRTIYCIAISAVFFEILPHFPMMFCAPGGLLYLPDNVLIPLLAGLCEGVGLGFVLRYGGSTGGSDIFAMIVDKYWPITPGKFYLVTDSVIIALILFLPDKTFADLVYGYIMMILSSLSVDFVMIGGKSTVQVHIFSEKSDEIASFVLNELDRGVTILKATGGYTGEDKKVLLLLIRSKELHRLSQAVKSIDPKAFMSVATAKSVFGEGFEQIKTGINRKKRVKDEKNRQA